ncbi:MAG: AMP-binding protein [Bacteroidales bacterium]|nr:AMP-binding protein [Bacteroidales bacterium]
MNAFDYFFENTSTLEKPFLVGKEEITFKDLFESCLNLAGWLRKEIGQNKHILLLSVNNLFFLKVYFAIIKSGNICIPLDPNIEKENFRYIYDLTKPELVFLTHDVEKRLELKSDKSIFPDTLQDPGTLTTHLSSLTTHHSSMNAESFDRERCAEIIFTSGSTGKPKGVMISHKNLIANTSSIVEYLQLTENDRILVFLPFYYCYGLSLLHTHLRVGGSIVFNNSFIFLGSVIKSLLDNKCTGFAGVPTHFQILLRKSDSFKKTIFPDLKYVTQAGGKLAPIFIDEFRESHPEIRFIVMYGQTEATARLSWLPPELWEKKKGSMGKGIPGVELKVVNEKGEKIKPGETGEVIARGENVMIGYFADEEGTQNTIRNGWLYTGDLGTVDEEDYIYLTARSKEIIKVRGKRISPKEIEAVILSIPEVIDCTIEGVEDEIEGEMLKATVVIRKDSINTITKDFIIQHCSQHLALYKVPQVYELKDDLTISPTGKKIKKV